MAEENTGTKEGSRPPLNRKPNTPIHLGVQKTRPVPTGMGYEPSLALPTTDDRETSLIPGVSVSWDALNGFTYRGEIREAVKIDAKLVLVFKGSLDYSRKNFRKKS